MSAYIRVLIVVAVLILASVFFLSRPAEPGPVYMAKASESVRHMVGAADTLLDRQFMDAWLLTQAIGKNYAVFEHLHPPASKFIQHVRLRRRLKSCEAAAALFDDAFGRGAAGPGVAYEHLGRRLQAIEDAQALCPTEQ